MDSFCFVFLCLGPDTCIPVSQRTVWSFSASDAPIGSTARQPVHQNLSCTQDGTSFLTPTLTGALKGPLPPKVGGPGGLTFRSWTWVRESGKGIGRGALKLKFYL